MATLQSIQAKIQKLQAQAEELAAAKSTAALEKIRDLMEKHDVSIAEIEAFVGRPRGRKSPIGAAAKKSSSTAKYRDPKTGATWTGHGRAPAWIANAKNRTRFLIAEVLAQSAVAKKVGNYVRGTQPALYRDPKSGATWSGRGRAPSWIASAKDRSMFLIADGKAPAKLAKPKAGKVAPTKKAGARTTTAKSAPARKGAGKKVATPVRKERVPKRATKAARQSGAAVDQAPDEIGVAASAT
ncbi:H-NS family nucleoid-associated regulatory protein [Burkholderia ambifaria]|uniref:Histone family protein nucleoid-structuring protein H-NS n=1 Tax=Burkholderia ambifaria MEX-5 TaxID=396597 RepID=B1TD53_9BURK|nr:H-NS family nucleoid-associated regulatory protein [Burkholderia ambifaria]EDT38495.1 histone family protein nucleoid-structuring protein H-NS [Burkholderia ambifaria MEX-5]